MTYDDGDAKTSGRAPQGAAVDGLRALHLRHGAAGAAFFTSPPGEIHSSVLVAYGEVMTFAGALFGIDYHYRGR